MITVESTDQSVRVTIPHDDVSPEVLNDVLARLQLESALRRSTLTEAEADQMAEEAKASWWAANKDRFIPIDQQ